MQNLDRLTALFKSIIWTLKFKAQPTNAFWRHRQTNVWRHPSFRLRPTSGNQIVEHSSDNETVLGSSRTLGGVWWPGNAIRKLCSTM